MRNVSATRNLVFTRTILAEGMAVALLVVLYFAWKSTYIAPHLIPVWDGNVYLLNAHDLLTGQQLYIWNYPLLMPGIIALVWSVTGENYLPMRFFSLTFTIATAVVLYYSTRSEFGRITSYLLTITYLMSIQVLIWSDQIHVHGLTSFFAILALVTSRKRTYSGSIVGGVFAALSVLARYPSLAIVFPIFVAFAITNRKRPRLIAAAILGACIPTLVFQLAFPFVLPHFLDIYFGYNAAHFTSLPYQYYIVNWYSFFGIIGVFGLVALFLPSIYRSDSSRAWAFWLIGALVFFTIGMLQKEDRYTFEWTPAVVYLSFLFLTKIKDRLLSQPAVLRSRFLSGRVSGTQRRMVFGTLLISLVLLQSCTFGAAYIQFNANHSYFGENSLLVVADYLKSHIPANATFLTDFDAPALAYFSGRYGVQIWVYTSYPGYLDYLRGYMRYLHARYFLVFPGRTADSVEVLEGSDFLELEGIVNVPDIGSVYLFHST
jgi:hypothetical protein